MDARLNYKEHIARAASRGVKAAIELRRMCGLSPATARQLFTAMVAPTVDYASNVWRHACIGKRAKMLDQVQKIGAQAITGAFRTVATSVAEAEAHISGVQQRLWKHALRLWVDLHTLPESNPLRREAARMKRVWKNGFQSPFRQVAVAFNSSPLENLERIRPFALAPWQQRITEVGHGEESAPPVAHAICNMRVAVSSSSRNEVVGVAGAAQRPGSPCKTFSFTLGKRSEQNPYSGELAAMAYAARWVPPEMCDSSIVITTSNKAAALAVQNPRQQSGQKYIRSLYNSIDTLRARGNDVAMQWVPKSDENELLLKAKREAREMTKPDTQPTEQFSAMRPTTANIARTKIPSNTALPDKVGKFSKRVDSALPRKHTKKLYDQLNHKEAAVLVQLRTGMARLNGYLHQIGAAPSDMCDCGQARETVDHFLFTCSRWAEQ